MNGWVGGSSLDGQQGGGQFNAIAVARCVGKSAFQDMDALDMDDSAMNTGSGRQQGERGERMYDSEEEDDSGHRGGEKRQKITGGFGGRMASLVVSKPDGVTPLVVGGLEADVVVGPPGSSDSGVKMAAGGQDKSCSGCFELRTKDLAPDTTELRAEARVVTGAAAAVAGIFYVALLSG